MTVYQLKLALIEKSLLALFAIGFASTIWAHDWDNFPVPVDAGRSKVWQLQEDVADDFNYDAPAKNKGWEFAKKWTDFYHNAWTGPGLSVWNRSHVHVADGKLHITASRVPGSDKIYLGCITSKKTVIHPIYIEARAKISNSTLSSDVWLLSPDDTQEIDVLEAYGASWSAKVGKDQSWFAERLHLSHHVFIRDPFQDYQPTDPGTWYHDGTVWREDYHRIGVYWRNPWHLEFYVDGNLARIASGKDIIDPKRFTEGSGLSKAMNIIINAEDQTWRSESGLTPTDEEFKNQGDHTFKVDWIRVYKPVGNP